MAVFADFESCCFLQLLREIPEISVDVVLETMNKELCVTQASGKTVSDCETVEPPI